jgi:hypothetical protein
MFPIHIQKIFDHFSEHEDTLKNSYKIMFRMYSSEKSVAKCIILGRYRDAKVDSNMMIGINKIFDDFISM